MNDLHKLLSEHRKWSRFILIVSFILPFALLIIMGGFIDFVPDNVDRYLKHSAHELLGVITGIQLLIGIFLLPATWKKDNHSHS